MQIYSKFDRFSPWGYHSPLQSCGGGNPSRNLTPVRPQLQVVTKIWILHIITIKHSFVWRIRGMRRYAFGASLNKWGDSRNARIVPRGISEVFYPLLNLRLPLLMEQCIIQFIWKREYDSYICELCFGLCLCLYNVWWSLTITMRKIPVN